MATKINGKLNTKDIEELKKVFVTKKDLDTAATGLSIKINLVEERFDKFEAKMENRFDKVMKHLVGLAGLFTKLDEERVASNAQLDRHEERIGKLETAVLHN